MENFTIIILIFGGLYCLFIIAFFFAFKRSASADFKLIKAKDKIYKHHTFSIIVAMRNESKNISNLISDIEKQEYLHSNFELILVDDESNDNSLYLAEKLLYDSTIPYKLLQSAGGKKNALAKGINESKNEIILFTDADCRLYSKWVTSFNIKFSKSKLMLISGPVVFETSNTVLNNFFRLEFASLVASGAAAIEMGIPIMANGANLAVRRELIEDIGDRVYFSDIASGDDVFLMSEARKKNGFDCIGFLNHPNALVCTQSPKNIKAFINQRIRWASKSKKYNDGNIIAIAFFIFVINLILATTFFLALFFGWEYFKIYFVLFFSKSLFDAALLVIFNRQFSSNKLMIYLLPLQLIYPFYIISIAILGQFMPFYWKGRRF